MLLDRPSRRRLHHQWLDRHLSGVSSLRRMPGGGEEINERGIEGDFYFGDSVFFFDIGGGKVRMVFDSRDSRSETRLVIFQ